MRDNSQDIIGDAHCHGDLWPMCSHDQDSGGRNGGMATAAAEKNVRFFYPQSRQYHHRLRIHYHDLRTLVPMALAVPCANGRTAVSAGVADFWGQLAQQKASLSSQTVALLVVRDCYHVKNEKDRLKHVLQKSQVETQFHIPLTEQAFQDLQELQIILQEVQVTEHQRDSWNYIWGSPKYSAKKFYNYPFQNISPPSPFRWIWKSRCSNKLRVFSWLLFMDRLNTKNLLRRKNFKLDGNNHSCGLCTSNSEETALHLFFACQFSRDCWSSIGIYWRFSLPFFRMMIKAKQEFQAPFFMEILIVAAWNIWKQRNQLIFEGKPPCIHSWKQHFIDEIKLQAHRFKDSSRQTILDWVQNV